MQIIMMQGGSPSQRRQWLVGIATVVFDLDLGQQMDNLHPPGVLHDTEREAIEYSSFPVCTSRALLLRMVA